MESCWSHWRGQPTPTHNSPTPRSVALQREERDRERQTETERDRQRDRERQRETDRERACSVHWPAYARCNNHKWLAVHHHTRTLADGQPSEHTQIVGRAARRLTLRPLCSKFPSVPARGVATDRHLATISRTTFQATSINNAKERTVKQVDEFYFFTASSSVNALCELCVVDSHQRAGGVRWGD